MIFENEAIFISFSVVSYNVLGVEVTADDIESWSLHDSVQIGEIYFGKESILLQPLI
mgnify:CR=1 FL=1